MFVSEKRDCVPRAQSLARGTRSRFTLTKKREPARRLEKQWVSDSGEFDLTVFELAGCYYTYNLKFSLQRNNKTQSTVDLPLITNDIYTKREII